MYEHLKRLAYRKLINKSYAEDIVQDVFVKALDYLRRNPDANLSGYILKRNTVILSSHANKKTTKEVSLD